MRSSKSQRTKNKIPSLETCWQILTKCKIHCPGWSVPLTISYYIIDKNNRKLEVVENSGTKVEFIINGNSNTIASNFRNYTIECNLGKNNRLILSTNELSMLSNLNDIVFTKIIQRAQSDISVRNIPARKVKMCSYKIENDTIDVASADISKRGCL